MAVNNTITDTYMQNLLKTVYKNGVVNNKIQGSRLLSLISKKDFGVGKELRYATQISNGANFGSDLEVLTNNAGQGAVNLEWSVTPGHAAGFFTINRPELQASDTETKAYMGILENKMSALFDGLSKEIAVFLFGGKFGAVAKLSAGLTVTAGSGNTLKLDTSACAKINIGTRLVVASAGAADKALPSSPVLDSIFTVTKVDKANKTITFTSTGAETLYAGDYLELYTARNGSTALGIEGLPDLIPSYFDRSGADWDTYIQTPFREVDRSQDVEALAGQFIKADSNVTSPYSTAILEALQSTTIAGGLDNVVVVSPDDYTAIMKEINTVAYQSVNGKAGETGKTFGFNSMAFAWGDATINRIIPDVYAFNGTAYVLDLEDLDFLSVGNVAERVINTVKQDATGKYAIESVGKQGVSDEVMAKINWDKLFDIAPTGFGTYGLNMTVAASILGNFKIEKTNSVAVVKLY